MSDTPIPFDRPESRVLGAGRLSAEGRLSRREQIKMLTEKVARYEALLHLDEPMDEDSWGEHAPQELRDTVAASALIESALNPIGGLVRLGFTIEDTSDPKWKRLAASIFSTPGVRAILSADAEKFAGNKDKVMSAMYEIATDPLAPRADRVRAVNQLAKMNEGWQDGEKVKNPALAMNFLMQIAGSAGHGNGNGARVVDPAELPPGDDGIVDAESFFVERGEEVVAVVDEPK